MSSPGAVSQSDNYQLLSYWVKVVFHCWLYSAHWNHIISHSISSETWRQQSEPLKDHCHSGHPFFWTCSSWSMTLSKEMLQNFTLLPVLFCVFLMLRCYYSGLNLWITLLDKFPESRGASLHISLGEKELKRLSSTWGVVLFLLFNWKNTCVCSFENWTARF